jgi:hypothetical protein
MCSTGSGAVIRFSINSLGTVSTKSIRQKGIFWLLKVSSRDLALLRLHFRPENNILKDVKEEENLRVGQNVKNHLVEIIVKNTHGVSECSKSFFLNLS